MDKGREAARFAAAALALGGIAVWGSENFFWSLPHADLTVVDFGLTWMAYAVAGACVLSLIGSAGMGGIGAAFLGGAVLGYLVEGAVAGTIYAAFPFQMVWTPLAWHGLVTGAAVFGLGRMAGVWGPWRMAVVWAGVGLFGGVWGLYWPLEGYAVPGVGAQLVYLLGLGLLVPLGHGVLDRLGSVPRPWGPVQAVGPAVLGLIWAGQSVVGMNVLAVLLPLVLGLIYWVARRLGGAGEVSFGVPARRIWHHGVFMVAPLVTVAVSQAGWAILGGVEVNGVVAGVTCGTSLGWLGWLIWKAARQRRV